jgi:hypothetical protein
MSGAEGGTAPDEAGDPAADESGCPPVTIDPSIGIRGNLHIRRVRTTAVHNACPVGPQSPLGLGSA